jgi:hypothetical protein
MFERQAESNTLWSGSITRIDWKGAFFFSLPPMLRYRVCDLIWHPAGRLVRFVAVIHPTRGSCLLMSTPAGVAHAGRTLRRRLYAPDLEFEPLTLFEMVHTPIECQQEFKRVFVR